MKYVVALFVILNFLSCKMIESLSDDTYFEGFVEFNTKTVTEIDQVYNLMNKIYGKKIVTYVNKEGFFSREFIDSTSIIVRKQIYRPDSMAFYDYTVNSDTIFKSEASSDKNDKNISLEDVGPVNILNMECKGIKCINKHFDTATAMYIPYNITYYFDSSKKLSPGAYAGIKWQGIESAFSKYPYVTMGMVFEMPKIVTVTSLATRVVKVDVESLHFDIPKNRVIIEQQ